MKGNQYRRNERRKNRIELTLVRNRAVDETLVEVESPAGCESQEVTSLRSEKREESGSGQSRRVGGGGGGHGRWRSGRRSGGRVGRRSEAVVKEIEVGKEKSWGFY